MIILSKDMGDRLPLADSCAIVTRTGGEAGCCRHTNREVIGVVLSHNSARTAGGTITDGLPFQQENLPFSASCQVIGNTGSYYTATNDNNIGCFGHDCSFHGDNLVLIKI